MYFSWNENANIRFTRYLLAISALIYVQNHLEQTYKKRHKALQEFTPREHTQLWFTRRTIEKQDIITQFG